MKNSNKKENKKEKITVERLKRIDYIFFVESPTKKYIFKDIFGDKCIVFATFGHIKKLSVVDMGFDRTIYKETYVDMIRIKKFLWFKKKKIIQMFKQKIIIATDNDREGELIAFHLNLIFNISNYFKNRMLFNELTHSAINLAITKLVNINLLLISSQQSRRILDRFIGFSFSNFLTKLSFPVQSAGRVQTCVLKLINDRYQKFLNSKNKYIYSLKIFFDLLDKNNINESFSIISVNKFKKEEEIKQYLQKEAVFIVNKLNIKKTFLSQLKPFITSSIQRFMYNKFRINPGYTMRLLQKLYEGNLKNLNFKGGLITYLRTDSYRVSKEMEFKTKKFLNIKFGEKYILTKTDVVINNDNKKINIQDAHECIRPTNLSLTPESIKDKLITELYRLYNVIYYRFLRSQMKPPILKKFSIVINSPNNDLIFKKKWLFFDNECFKGYFVCYNKKEENPILTYVKNVKIVKIFSSYLLKKLNIKSIDISKVLDKKLVLLNPSSVIKILESKSIGRPSTYASFVPKLKLRKYIISSNKGLIVSNLGIYILHILKFFVDILLDENLTANMEKDLNKIEHNLMTKKNFLDLYLKRFSEKVLIIKKFILFFKKFYFKIDWKCMKCGYTGIMRLKSGIFGLYIKCNECNKNFSCSFNIFLLKVTLNNNILVVDKKKS